MGVSSFDYWQRRCAHQLLLLVVMLDTPCSEVVRRVLTTHSICHFLLRFPSRASPCAITFQLESTYLFGMKSAHNAAGCFVSRVEIGKRVNPQFSCRRQSNYIYECTVKPRDILNVKGTYRVTGYDICSLANNSE